MTHASQYAMAGPIWWEEYVRYIIHVALTPGQPKPYGDGSGFGAGRAEAAEGMAYSLEFVIADNKYGLAHSFNADPQFFRFINRAEVLTFHETAEDFIPSGLFFDLYDQNGVFPTAVSRPEPLFVTDQVGNFPFETQVEVFALPGMENIDQFKNYLWQFHGAASGSILTDYNQLFQSYGH